MTNAIDAFTRHGLGVRFEDLPAEAVSAAKTFLLDTLGVGIAGAAAPLSRNIRAASAKWGEGRGAHIWGPGAVEATAPTAAFVNGFQIHGQEFDCVHEPAVVHPLATILAALMAECEIRGDVSGKDLAVAMAVSVDMAAGLGVAVTSPIRFFRPANAGLFGATLGLSRLRGFDETQTKDAMGYALSFCSGTMQAHVEGKPALPVQIANAARAAIMAVDLAETGLPGPHDTLEGPFGYFALFEEAYDIAPVVVQLGKTWRIAEVSHKPFPTGRAAQGGIVLIQKLLADGVTAGEIEHLELSAPPLIHRLVGRPLVHDMTANYARLCFQYSGAVTLLKGGVRLDDFSEAALQDDDTRALGARITVLDNGTTDPAAFTPQIATATLKDGRTVTAQIDALYGSPADPMSREAHIEKFRSCCAFGFGDTQADIENRLIQLTDKLETLDDVSRLARLAAGMEA